MTTTHRIATTVALTLSLAAAGAPIATARDSGSHPATTAHQSRAAVYSRQDKSLIPVGTSDNTSVTGERSAPAAIVRIQTPQSGFDWGDAGIGAAGGVALALLGLGGAVAISQRRPHGNRHTTPLS
jgi:hypothetical protein